jgi:hypothetical protein
MPAAVALRPRDERGYPVPAITPWVDGQPRFAANGTARAFICAVERRCSICGTPMPPGPVWRVVSGAEAEAIAAMTAAGQPYVNRAATAEAPGHRACMLYAAVVCPYLARPTARRGQDATASGLAAVRGDRRDAGGAVVAFDDLEYRLAGAGDTPTGSGIVLFRFAGLRACLPHQLGEEHLDELRAAVGAEPPAQVPPDYLMQDETAAQRRFDTLRSAGGLSAPAGSGSSCTRPARTASRRPAPRPRP